MTARELKDFLDERAERYNSPEFIETDPISIPHLFSDRRDIEISGFLIATIAWGQRVSIIKSGKRILELLDNSPFDFVSNHQAEDLRKLEGFVHRTFNSDDLLFFISSLQNIYRQLPSLEAAFLPQTGEENMKNALFRFRQLFLETQHLSRSEKHISNPFKNSACKRLNMYLRWMVRKDNKGVDFGIWNSISPALLSCPLDVHSANVARRLGVLKRKQNDWKAVEELDSQLRKMDQKDPVKYDFALFGLGVFEKF